jgi:dCTP diphosphatase
VSDETTTIADLRWLIRDFVHQRDWEQFHNPKNLAMAISIEAAELMEHFQWLRTDELPGVRNDPEAMRQIAEELADVTAFVLSFANALDIDLSSAVRDKMTKNKLKYPADRFRGRFR